MASESEQSLCLQSLTQLQRVTFQEMEGGNDSFLANIHHEELNVEGITHSIKVCKIETNIHRKIMRYEIAKSVIISIKKID